MFGSGKNAAPMIPRRLQDKTLVLGRDDLRYFAEKSDPALIRDVVSLIEKCPTEDATGCSDGFREYSMLAVSGGSGDGAYGAGVLNGWSAHGTRPTFKAVTGISTGALIAPLVFLGKEYDHILEKFYTNTSIGDILRRKGPISIIFGNSLASNRPLENTIRSIVTRDFLRKVAAERAKGRGLYVGTTNFYAQRLVIWDMAKIAEIGDRRAVDLFCRIILASTAIPAVFPPVFFDVMAGGKRYREMHVDGGAVAQVFFLYGAMRDFAEELSKREIDRSKLRIRLYVILNGYLSPQWEAVGNNMLSMIKRYIDTLSLAENRGDIGRLYFFAREHGHEFKLAYIPPSFEPENDGEFDKKNMRRLFDLGRKQAEAGYPWVDKIETGFLTPD